MRRAETHPWWLAGVERLLPARRAQAPAVARLQPREAGLRHRRRQIVAGGAREREKIGVDPGAHGVHAEIVRAGLTAAGALKPGQRFRPPFGERLDKRLA